MIPGNRKVLILDRKRQAPSIPVGSTTCSTPSAVISLLADVPLSGRPFRAENGVVAVR